MVLRLHKIETRQDFLSALPILQKIMTEYEGLSLSPPDPELSLQSWRKARNFGCELYAVFKEDRLVAVFGLAEMYDPLSQYPLFRLGNLVVDTPHRRQGIGSAIVAEVEKMISTKGAQSLVLEVSQTNKPAVALYRSRGFQYVCDRWMKVF